MDKAPRPLPAEDAELVAFARHVVEADGDGDTHTVGAAVRDAAGRIFGGINVAHFTGGPCAELVALGHARASGARDMATIVAVGDRDRGVLAPCGRCRQVLLDQHPDIRVLIPTPEGVRSVTVGDLLPYAYVWSDNRLAHTPPAVQGVEPARPQSLTFHPDYLDAVRAGTKTATVRRHDRVRPGPVGLVFELDDPVTLPGVVTRVEAKRFAELTEADAVADGCRDVAELRRRLPRHYPGMGPADPVTVVHFRLAD